MYITWTKFIRCFTLITSLREHLNRHEDTVRTTKHGGLACRVRGLVCERSVKPIPGENTHYCFPYFTSNRLQMYSNTAPLNISRNMSFMKPVPSKLIIGPDAVNR